MQSTVAARIAAGLSKISLVLRHHAWEASSRETLTPTQAQILAVLHHGSAVSPRLADVAALMSITPPTASDAVTSLVAKGLVKREAAAADGRAIALRLTRKGRRVAERVSAWPDFLLAAVDSLPAGMQAQLLEALTVMVRSLQDQGRIPLARMCLNCTFFEPDRYPGSVRPHYCGFVKAAFGPPDFRLDCSDFTPAPEQSRAANLKSVISLSTRKGDDCERKSHSGL